MLVSSHCGTILPLVSADGKLLMVFFILSAKFGIEDESNLQIALPRHFYFTRFGGIRYKFFVNESG
jgi:hypothetical protein